jgi:hypothetical protein
MNLKMATLQFKRVFNYTGNFDDALYNIKNKLNPALKDGEPMLCSYREGSDSRFFIAIGAGDGKVVIHPSFNNQSELIAYIKKHAGTSIKLEDLISEESDFIVSNSSENKYVFKIKDDVLNTKELYKQGDGITIIDDTISVAVDPDDKFLSVTKNGLSVKGLSDVVANIKVTDVDNTSNNGISLTKNNDGIIGISVNIEEVSNAIFNNPDNPVDGTVIKLGQSIIDKDEQVEIAHANSSIYEAIQAVADKKYESMAGGITSIKGDKYIAVTGDSTVKTIELDVAKIGTYLVDNYSALKVNNSTGELSVE